MPISAAGNKRGERSFGLAKRAPENGFTLVELMIVVVIIGLATAAVVWALPDPRGRLADEASRFAGRAKAARDLAIVDGRPVSVWVTAGGYGFEQRRGGSWIAIGEKPLRVERWGEGTNVTLGDPGGRDRVEFDSTGLTDHAVTVRLARGDAKTSVAIGVNGAIEVGS